MKHLGIRYAVALKTTELNAISNLATYEDLERAEKIRLNKCKQYKGWDFVTIEITYEQVTHEAD